MPKVLYSVCNSVTTLRLVEARLFLGVIDSLRATFMLVTSD